MGSLREESCENTVMPALLCPSCQVRLRLPATLPDNVQVLRCPQCKVKIPAKAVKKSLAKSQPQAPPPPPPPQPKTTTPKHSPPPKPKEADPGLLPDFDEIGIQGEPAAAPPPPPKPARPAAKVGQDTELIADLADIKILDDEAPPAPDTRLKGST